MPGVEYPTRYKLELNRGWRFVRGKAAPSQFTDGDSKITTVSLPHCWNSRDTFQRGVTYYRGKGTYQLQFQVPDDAPFVEPGQWILQIDGFYGKSTLQLNDQPLGDQDGQYLGFEVDVTSYLHQLQRNTLTAVLDNRHRRDTLPGIKKPDFLLFGGLSGSARLVKRPRLFLNDRNIRIDTWPREQDAWHLRTTFAVSSVVPVTRCEVHWTLITPDGETLGSSISRNVEIGTRGESSIQTAAMDLVGIQCWDIDHPVLYTLRARIIQYGNTIDEALFRVGFRTAEFLHDEGLFLNGRRIELRGCNRHESMPGFGRALPAVLQREDAARIKEMGLNFVRLSHYPQHPEFLDACDELGLLVYAEIATWRSVRGYGKWLRAACRQAEALVRRDRHRPCILIWGMGTESRSRRAYAKLQKTIHKLDSHRPVTYAENRFCRARCKRTLRQVDVWSLNGKMDGLRDAMQASRMRNVIISECAKSPDANRGNLEREAEQVQTIISDLRRALHEPFVAGFALWCLNDYATLHKKHYLRHSGVHDAWRQTKMAADFLRARYTTEPFIRLFADWEIRANGDDRDIYICTNCSQVALRIDNRQITQTAGSPFLRLRIPFTEATLIAEGGSGGTVIRDSCAPWRNAYEIQLQVSTMPVPDWLDCRAQVVDGDGHPVLSWNGDLTTSLQGHGEIYGYTADNRIQVSRGCGRFFAHVPGSELGSITATAKGLMPCTITTDTNPGGKEKTE